MFISLTFLIHSFIHSYIHLLDIVFYLLAFSLLFLFQSNRKISHPIGCVCVCVVHNSKRNQFHSKTIPFFVVKKKKQQQKDTTCIEGTSFRTLFSNTHHRFSSSLLRRQMPFASYPYLIRHKIVDKTVKIRIKFSLIPWGNNFTCHLKNVRVRYVTFVVVPCVRNLCNENCN